MERIDQYVCPTERVSGLTLKFAQGMEATTAEVAVMLALGYSGAHKMLGKMSTAIPLVVSEEGKWSLLQDVVRKE